LPIANFQFGKGGGEMRKQLFAAAATAAVFCGALVSSAQNATTPLGARASAPVAATLSDAEREKAILNLDATRQLFVKAISGISEKQWRYKPAPDRWSIAEVAEHITVTESAILTLVREQVMKSPSAPEKREEINAKDEIVLTKIPDRSTKMQAPESLKPTGRFATRAELAKTFDESRQATIEYVRTTNDDLREHFGEHPVLGELDGYQWLLLNAAHCARHTKQIEEVKADPGYPKD
jgi:uncharacterized damage-inducible protein DinB